MDTLEKISKSKVWIWSDAPMANVIFQEAGVPGVPLTYRMCWSGCRPVSWRRSTPRPRAAIALQWFTRIKYLSDTPLLFLPGGSW